MTAAEDRETREAVAIVTRQIEANPEADAEPLAQAIVAALKGYGWRRVEGLAPPVQSTGEAGRLDPDAKARALAMAARAVAAQQAEAHRGRGRGGGL